jgi:hypothetical protein
MMPAAQTRLLAPAGYLLRASTADSSAEEGTDAASDVLEAAASRLGGFDLDGYRELAAPALPWALSSGLASAWAEKVLTAIAATPVPARLALAALAQPQTDPARARTTGAYYTDFRLAAYLAARVAALPGRPLGPASTVVDAAAGTGILLAALVDEICRGDAGVATELVGRGVCAADVDPGTLRGTAAVLASFTSDLDAIGRMRGRLLGTDSLLASADAWARLAPGGFDAVIGNPPWERLRSTRHEVLRAAGVDRRYGSEYGPGHATVPTDGRFRRYAEAVFERYPLPRGREIDLYQAFIELGLRLCGDDGRLGLLVPAGLIRSQGTTELRSRLLTGSASVDLTVLHNRARFFEIDSRVKFLALARTVAGTESPGPLTPCHGVPLAGSVTLCHGVPLAGSVTLCHGVPLAGSVTLRHAGADGSAVLQTAATSISLTGLAAARPDRSVPEVRGQAEWRLFQRMAATGVPPSQPGGSWAMRILREVDMVEDRALFGRRADPSEREAWLPIVEGRMVNQHRSRAKTHVAGTGRSARWDPVPLRDAARARSQFLLPSEALAPTRRRRARTHRVGFCDIVGQTNERTLQAALIPPGRICGNKVPTVDLLVHADDPDRPFVLVAVLNSLPVDWLLRRVVTTSLNYFVLLGLPLPAVAPGSAASARLAFLGRALHAAEGDPGVDLRDVAAARAEVDRLVLDAYGLDAAAMRLILTDFTLLDRGQPALPGETRSTVTADLVRGMCDPADEEAATRHAAAAALGAVAYVPEEFARRPPQRIRRRERG